MPQRSSFSTLTAKQKPNKLLNAAPTTSSNQIHKCTSPAPTTDNSQICKLLMCSHSFERFIFSFAHSQSDVEHIHVQNTCHRLEESPFTSSGRLLHSNCNMECIAWQNVSLTVSNRMAECFRSQLATGSNSSTCEHGPRHLTELQLALTSNGMVKACSATVEHGTACLQPDAQTIHVQQDKRQGKGGDSASTALVGMKADTQKRKGACNVQVPLPKSIK